MIKSINTICFILVSVVVFAQSSADYEKFKGTKVRASMEARLDKPYFKRYGNPRIKQFVSVNANTPFGAVNEPEHVLWQIFRAEPEEAIKQYLTPGFKPNAKKYKQSFNTRGDSSRNFIVPHHKLTFTIGDQRELAILKYSQFIDSVRVEDFSIQLLYGDDKKWRATEQKQYQNLEFAILNITEEYFWSLSKKTKLDEDEKYISQAVLDRVKDDEGYLNLTKLAEYIRQQMAGNKKSPFID